MAVQDVRELIPRVRRAIEGPVPQSSGALTNDQVLALAADAAADIILFTAGLWNHKLIAVERDAETNVPTEWGIDPQLEFEEESVIAAQAAISFFFYAVRDMKTSESIVNEGQTWEWQISANVLRDQIKFLQEQRDLALAALARRNPVMARYASILAVRDRLGAAVLEPFTYGSGLLGGEERGMTWTPVSF